MNKVPDMGDCMDDRKENHGPGYLLYIVNVSSVSHIPYPKTREQRGLTMKINIPIERDNRVQWRSPEKGDELPAYWEQDDDYVDYLVNDFVLGLTM